MRVTTLRAPRDLHVARQRPLSMSKPTDALVSVVASAICGSDLWWYRGANTITSPKSMGHEVVGLVQEVGEAVTRVRTGDFVVVPFCHADGSCPVCRKGLPSACQELGSTIGGQGDCVLVSHADACLLVTDRPADDVLLRSLLTLTDVMATGWHAAVSANVQQGCTAVVVGDGAVGLCGVLAARRLGAAVVIALSHREARQRVARSFGATHLVGSRGDEAVTAVQRLTDGWGADAVLECVGTPEAMDMAVHMARPGATVGFVGIPHGVELPVRTLFERNVGVRGGITPVQKYLPHLAELVISEEMNPGLVLDREVALDDVDQGYRAMDDRDVIKVVVRP